MATVSVEQSELEYYRSCAEKIRKIDKILVDKKLRAEEKMKEIRKVIRASKS